MRLIHLMVLAAPVALFGSVEATCSMTNGSAVFTHPGLLHSAEDLARMKTQVAAGAEPWAQGFEMLTNNSHASLSYKSRAVEIVYRGSDGVHSQNYGNLYNDAAAAYALALRWWITEDDEYADKAVEVLNAWGSTLTEVTGNSDKFLASGIYGYQLANAAELMRDYSGWNASAFETFQTMMLDVFYPMNHRFLVNHNDAKVDHYWANWDLANMATMLAIGVLTDRADLYDEAVTYFMEGAGNGAIEKLVWILYPDGLGQIQESGRDQGHSTLDIALVGSFCQMAWNQQCDLFGYDDNRVLKGAEYVAQYNLGLDVNYTTYTNSDVTQTEISNNSRGNVRPMWELVYNHYVVKQGLSAPSITSWAEQVRPEGGGGNYGSNSGGYDQLGYGTLTFTLGDTTSTSGSGSSSVEAERSDSGSLELDDEASESGSSSIAEDSSGSSESAADSAASESSLSSEVAGEADEVIDSSSDSSGSTQSAASEESSASSGDATTSSSEGVSAKCSIKKA